MLKYKFTIPLSRYIESSKNNIPTENTYSIELQINFLLFVLFNQKKQYPKRGIVETTFSIDICKIQNTIS